MVGIASLMPQQGQMPGQAQQAPLPGMMPKPGAATPAAEISQYAGMGLEELVALFQQRPSGVLLRKIEDETKAQQMRAAAQNQGAMAQMQQQPGTVKDMVLGQAVQSLQPTQIAAHGGIMHGYAGGGAVAFRNGGDPEEERLRQQIRDMFESVSSPFNILGPRADQERQRAQDIMRMLPNLDKEQMRNILGQTQRMADPAAYQEFGPGERMEQVAPPVSVPPGRGMAAEKVRPAAPSATTFDITSPASINALRIAAQDTSLPEAERADLQRRIAMMDQQAPSRGMQSVAPSQAPAPSANLSPEMEAYFRNRSSELRTRQGLPEDVLSGRAGLEALARENIAAQRGEAETFSREARERRDAALARAQQDIFKDSAALLRLAGRIDTRKGQGFKSFSEGLGSLLTEREAAAEAAREKYATAQQTERALQANVRQATMLEAQRAQALRENDVTSANRIKDQIDALMMQRETLLMERKDKAIEQARLERVADAQVISATKPGETLSLLKELFPGQAPSLENLAKLRSAYSPSAADRQDTSELKLLQANLQKQVENILLPNTQRDAAAIQLERVNAKLAEMSGLGGAVPPTGSQAAPPVGTVMQGYRFKGGNPADRNNWEKV